MSDKAPSPTPDQQQIRGKAIASGSRKRSIRGHSRGLSLNKALRIGETVNHVARILKRGVN
ncbi:hypothetical protein PIB30_103149 [Stylosanthes scabra]|uniref:Histone H4 n=1 Tax=Stylosanthes scabra TaxID=79078 RepID=A0ABU6YYJ9_9FABA|nr:hypothetical protein [Stylosanthes scabra]